MEKEKVAPETIAQTYFAEKPKQLRVADLEQRFVTNGFPLPAAGQEALNAYGIYFKKQLKSKGIKVGLFLLCAALFLIKIINLFDKVGNVTQIAAFLALTAYALVQGLIWGMQLFQLKEEISSFRDLRKL
ncbi:hypothetical protein [Chitinophaga solisilvae]|uniref:hypothetical protein n=1 Tax=Chitinophaga solisilvae TaxID=1233460 RepID=UPI001367D1F6|nr:hypothetical protein [Chitinophaga solisilvae]